MRKRGHWEASQATHDELDLGPCPPAELPQLFARIEQKFRVRWKPQPVYLKTNLKGRHRTRFLAWLAPAEAKS